MVYSVKECFFTLQGEGAQSGRAAVFLRFAGCNLWSGRAQDRGQAVCDFCDTEFVGTDGEGGGKFTTPGALAAHALSIWEAATEGAAKAPFIVCTGGEPGLQLDHKLVVALHESGFEIAIESNGTVALDENIDWICVSPKADAPLVQTSGDELKLVYPQEKARPEQFNRLAFRYFYLQPMDGPDLAKNIDAAVRYCQAHPQWRLSLQNHKIIGIR